jgi:hypothetical protein
MTVVKFSFFAFFLILKKQYYRIYSEFLNKIYENKIKLF